MEYDKENWELKIEIRQGDIIPEDDDKDKCRKFVVPLCFSLLRFIKRCDHSLRFEI